MAVIFKNRMGDYHIWYNDEGSFSRQGQHNSLSTLNGEECDLYIQISREDFEADVISNLPQEQQDDIEAGYHTIVNIDLENY